MDLQAISDRLDIQQKMTDYATAIDSRAFDALDAVFTPDAHIDYTAMGGIKGDYLTVKAWLAETLPKFPAYLHMIGNIDIRLAGDAASSRIVCFNPMAIDLPARGRQMMFFGLWYRDRWVRTTQGWRLHERIEEKCFEHNVPGGINAGPTD
ncbi:MAG: nuclear transport factor 2 family protein [Pseudomonadota bacterium]|nr:nuclear transport factor 2 family protein [Pseudomonadota bacterium]